jgi:hypothetical protein
LSGRLYIDEDAMTTEVIAGLRFLRMDVVTTEEAGMRQSSDEDQLEFAKARSRVLYTLNRKDFLRIHTEWASTGRGHAGIILGEQKRYSPREQIRKLSKLMKAVSEESMKNRVEFLSRW